MDRLEGGVAVVTGGGSGIGRAIVLELAAAGMQVMVADIELDRAEAVAAEVTGGRAAARLVDVADYASVQRLAAETNEALGGVDVLCNNAGVLVFKGFRDSIIEDWQWVWGVNVMGVVNGIHAFLPGMLERGQPGHIVNTTSIAALSATGVYGTSKAAILALTDSLAAELSDTRIGVSALLPGVVSTQIVAAERNRPAGFGRRTEEPARQFAGAFGFDPSVCGRRVREGILAGQRYIWAGVPDDFGDIASGPRERLEALLAALPEGIIRSDRRAGGVYEVPDE